MPRIYIVIGFRLNHGQRESGHGLFKTTKMRSYNQIVFFYSSISILLIALNKTGFLPKGITIVSILLLFVVCAYMTIEKNINNED